MLDHALRTVSFIADIGEVLVLMARQPPEEHSNQAALKPSQILASVGTAQTDHKNIKITCHVFQAPEVCANAGQASFSFSAFLGGGGGWCACGCRGSQSPCLTGRHLGFSRRATLLLSNPRPHGHFLHSPGFARLEKPR